MLFKKTDTIILIISTLNISLVLNCNYKVVNAYLVANTTRMTMETTCLIIEQTKQAVLEQFCLCSNVNKVIISIIIYRVATHFGNSGKSEKLKEFLSYRKSKFKETQGIFILCLNSGFFLNLREFFFYI